VLLLDEPTDGLDPEGIHEFRGLVRRLRDEHGLTILLNSHLLSEVEQLCDRVAILKRGRLVYEGGVRPSKASPLLYRVRTEPANGWRNIAGRSGGDVRLDGLVEFAPGADPAALPVSLHAAGFRLVEFSPVVPRLEDLYLSVGTGTEDSAERT
jgi:ABC-2 type transport system ATP-binding protein